MGISSLFKGITSKLDNGMSDEKYIAKEFKKGTGRELNLASPQTLNEKIQWLKLNDHNPVYSVICDKLEQRDYIAERVGEENLIPLLGIFGSYDEVVHEAFLHGYVLKCTHGRGYHYICKDTYNLDRAEIRAKMNGYMQSDYSLEGRESPYKDLNRRIIAEAFLDDKANLEPIDYRVLCFNGTPKYTAVYSDKNRNDKKSDIYDASWEHLDCTWGFPNNEYGVETPYNYENMLDIAEKLSQNIPFLSVEFYEIGRSLYISGLSLYPEHGFVGIKPEQYDLQLGSLLDLSHIDD